MELTVEKLLSQVNSTQLSFKKINTYTSIELIDHWRLNSIVHEYWVMRKGKCVLKTNLIDEAVSKFNEYKDNKW